MDINVEQWLSELDRLSQQAPRQDDGALTALEIAELLHRHGQWVREKLIRPAMRQGRIVCVQKSVRQINGVVRRVPAYRITMGESP